MQDTFARPIVQIDALDFGYGERPILRHIDMTIQRGQVVAVMGASGGGKTTLLRLIGGQVRPQRGSVRFEGQDLAGASQDQIFAMRRRMGMLFQFGALFTDMSVFDNVAFPLREHTDLPDSMIRDLVLMKLNAVGLRGARDLYPAELSGGMARRVAMARAIALDPALVMYDEPFAGLDPISLGISARLIRSLNDALGLSSMHGTPQQMRESTDPLVHQFVRGEPDGPVHFHYPAAAIGDDFLRPDSVRKERA
ncbi:ATP-binding cassette domain-containing protein [Thiomonas sp. 13-64-67]|uniref:ABC transporter ATP-binding protein n=1 Tax=Thiomonas sp. 13-64-67 TaxID=1970447 RepID=UPI000BCA7B1F|nr:ATP-binding cassette domain-containing protein [Thiomonas sp. 13-64-67]OZB69650.1 MAG: ABC transporter ATP-binding protein [Thiomonas sp. 13-64-67]